MALVPRSPILFFAKNKAVSVFVPCSIVFASAIAPFGPIFRPVKGLPNMDSFAVGAGESVS